MSIVLCGMGGSGKDTVKRLLLEKGYNSIVNFTSRPMRDGEKDGREYHFVDEEYFHTHSFLECRRYETAQGNWFYGSQANGYTSANGVGILTPAGARIVKKQVPNAFVVFIAINRRDALLRMLKRGDCIDEAYRRNVSDMGMFEGFEENADLVVWSDELKPEQLVHDIDMAYTKWERGE